MIKQFKDSMVKLIFQGVQYIPVTTAAPKRSDIGYATGYVMPNPFSITPKWSTQLNSLNQALNPQ